VNHGKPDENQPEIVERLRAMGAKVTITSMVGCGFPDICVGWQGINYLFEIKTETGKLKKNQVKFHADWKGTIHTIRSFEEALEIINGIH
jgi:hypothetical protein